MSSLDKLHADVLRSAAKQVAAELPPMPDWDGITGAALPTVRLKSILRGAGGWPLAMVALSMPQETLSGPVNYRPLPDQNQDVLVVPEAWLRRLAEILGVPFTDCLRARVAE